MELQRRITTLTAALSEKAEENLEFAREVSELRRQRPLDQQEAGRRLRAAEERVEQLQAERQAQEELNQEFQRRITTLSVCLTELADMNALAFSDKLNAASEAQRLLFQNEAVQAVGRQAALGGGSHEEQHTPDRRPGSPAGGGLGGAGATPLQGPPVTPQLLQDYQGEIERLKFKLKKRKGKCEKLRLEQLYQKDLADAARKSCTKYEKEIKRLNAEMSEALEKEVNRRKKVEQTAKSLQRRIGELEFLLENDSIDDAEPAGD